MTDRLFHLVDVAAWDAARSSADSVLRPPSLTSEGFVHLSTRAQWPLTARRFFAGRDDVVLLELRADLLRNEVRFEAADGDSFPHLYGPLPLDAVVAVHPLAPRPDGSLAPLPASPSPPFSAGAAAVDEVRARGFSVVDAEGLGALAGVDVAALEELRPSWDDLPPDAWLKDGGHYRDRRHSCFVVAARAGAGGVVERVPHRAHFQSRAYNALHGGLERWFEPVRDDVAARPAFTALVAGLARACSAVKPAVDGDERWFVEAHQFRIHTRDGLGRPTPEGAHRDGVDFAVVVLVDRRGVTGGETRVFDAAGPAGVRFTLDEPWSVLLLDDERVVHETTPIQPVATGGHRDTLVLTFRRGGFQAP